MSIEPVTGIEPVLVTPGIPFTPHGQIRRNDSLRSVLHSMSGA